jgi:hypothetical protein
MVIKGASLAHVLVAFCERVGVVYAVGFDPISTWYFVRPSF